MFRLSKKALYAVEAVLDIAYNVGANPDQSFEITRRQGIPRSYIEQAPLRLVRGGILAGVRGPSGGYRLVRKRIHLGGCLSVSNQGRQLLPPLRLVPVKK